MVGWKRIVITVGEKIGKTHLTYGQGAAAEIVAMATIGAADGLGLPVSTTHVLSSGVAGTMVGQRLGHAMVDRAQHRAGLGADPAGGDAPVGYRCSSSSATLLTDDRCRNQPGGPRFRAVLFVLAQPPYQATGFARARGIRTSPGLQSSSVKYIIAVISASE